MWRTIGSAALMVTLSAGAASAQGMVQVVGGVTNQADQHPVLGAALAARGGALEIDVEGGRMFNIVPRETFDRARQVSVGNAEAKLPAWYGMTSLKVMVPAGPVTPFVTGGLGLARLEPQVEVTSGSTTATVVFGDNGDSNRNKFLLGGGGGVRLGTGRTTLDLGFKYIRIFENYRTDTNFENDDVRVNVRMFYAALGVRF